jgi:hypothetical protein
MADTAKKSAMDSPSSIPVENPSLPAAGKTRVLARPNSSPVAPKAAIKQVRGAKGPPHWDFKADGLLFSEDIEEALKLKRENPAAFKSSVRAQRIVAWSEQSAKWQLARARAIAKNFTWPFPDLRIARDRKRKPKVRLAALDRFVRLFYKMPMNVNIALFNWLNGGSKSEVVTALNRTGVPFQIDHRTGALIEADGRGRKRSFATNERIERAARRRNENMSQREMATELFPDLTNEQAYTRTRDFFLKYRYAIERMRYRLRRLSQTSPKSRR